jgi:hypothetical protein
MSLWILSDLIKYESYRLHLSHTRGEKCVDFKKATGSLSDVYWHYRKHTMQNKAILQHPQWIWNNQKLENLGTNGRILSKEMFKGTRSMGVSRIHVANGSEEHYPNETWDSTKCKELHTSSCCVIGSSSQLRSIQTTIHSPPYTCA